MKSYSRASRTKSNELKEESSMSKKTDRTKESMKAHGRRVVEGEISANAKSVEPVGPRAQLVPKGSGHAIRVQRATHEICAAAVRSGHRVSDVPKDDKAYAPDVREIHPHAGPFPSRTAAKKVVRGIGLELEKE